MSQHTKSLLVGASTLASVLAVQQASADSPLETVTEPVEKVQIPENLPQGEPPSWYCWKWTRTQIKRVAKHFEQTNGHWFGLP